MIQEGLPDGSSLRLDPHKRAPKTILPFPGDGNDAGSDQGQMQAAGLFSERTLASASSLDLWRVDAREAHLLTSDPQRVAIDNAIDALLKRLTYMPVHVCKRGICDEPGRTYEEEPHQK